MQRNYSFFLKKIKIKNIKRSSKKWNIAMMKTKNANFEDDFIIFLEFLNIFLEKSKKILRNRDSCKKNENRYFGGSFCNFLWHFSVKWELIVSFITEKKYQKILEKCEMSFYSFKNKKWTFRGSFNNFTRFFYYLWQISFNYGVN